MTVTLLSVKPEKNGCLRIRVSLDDGERVKKRSFLTTKADYEAVGMPCAEETLFYEDYMILAREADRALAKERAYMILASGDNTKKGLYQKLRKKGFSSDASQYAVTEMVSCGSLREDEYLRRALSYYSEEKLYGRRKTLASLLARGFSPDEIREAIRSAEESGELDFEESKRQLLLSKGELTPEEKKKLLFRYGY